MRSTLLGGFSGLVLVAAFPPSGAALLLVPALAAFFVAIRIARRPAHAWGAGAAFGLVFFTFLFPWIGELGVIALVPLVLSQAAYVAIYSRLLHAVADEPRWRWVLDATAGWGIMEFLRARFPVGGFAWGMAGYPVGEYSAFRGAAQWIGTSGWSMVVVALAAAVAVAITDRRVERWMAAPLALVVGLGVAGALFPAVADGIPVSVVVVQGSTPCPGTHCTGERAGTFDNSLRLTSEIEPGSADLVVWPEGSTGFDVDPVLDPKIGALIGDQARRIGAVLLAGGDRPVSDTAWINANVVWNPEGEIVGEYRKRHPVPFGEYIPARPLFSWIPELAQVPRDMIRGSGPVVFDVLGHPFGSVISFESSFARYSRDTVRAGARLLVVATSQASYPYSNASDQLIGMTRMRAAELGVDVVHAAVTGRSTLITDGGRIGDETGLGAVASISGTVRMRSGGLTLYALLGDWLQVLGMAWVVVRLIRAAQAKRS